MADAGHPMPRPEITEGWWWVADSAGVATTIVRVVAPWPEAWDFLNEAGDPLAVLVAGEEVPQRIRCHTFLAKIERP
jgi:hypothetical protein